MGKATLSNSKSHHKFTNLNYEEKQVATPPAHLQASVVGIRQSKTPQKLSKNIVRISEGRGTLVPR